MQPIVPPQAQAQAVPTYQPQAQAVPLPLVLSIAMYNVPLAVGQSGHPPNAQLLYGPLVLQNDEDRLLSGRQPTIVMYKHMIQKCFTCDLNMIQILCVHCISWSLGQKAEGGGLLMAAEFNTNVYYCIDNTACLRRELPGTVRDHLYMGNFYFQSVTPAHKAVLEEYRYWMHI